MTYETSVSKGYDGWQATSKAELSETPEGMRFLELRTAKSRTGINSIARVYILQKSGAFTSQVTDVFGDFYKHNISHVDCKRVTEKAVKAAHEIALKHMADLQKEAKEFYELLN